MKIKTVIFIITLFMNTVNLSAQLPDGVKVTTSFLEEIKKNIADENSIPFELNHIFPAVKIPVNVFIIKNRLAEAGVVQEDITLSIENANSYFENIGINFYIDSIQYINDYHYGYITNNRTTKELLIKFAVPEGINLFIADSIRKSDIRSYGFTYFPNVPDSNFIFLDKQFVVHNYLTTLLGHYMGLLSTHESLGGSELSNGNNCAVSGDFICDTYADPNLYNRVDNTCRYFGNLRDASGKYYIPSVANIMSNSADNCKCIFTPQQYRRMYFYYLKYRQMLN